jgi:hypothetical protein
MITFFIQDIFFILIILNPPILIHLPTNTFDNAPLKFEINLPPQEENGSNSMKFKT